MDSPHKDQRRGALCFLWSAPEQTVEQAIKMPVIFVIGHVSKGIIWIARFAMEVSIFAHDVKQRWCVQYTALNKIFDLTKCPIDSFNKPIYRNLFKYKPDILGMFWHMMTSSNGNIFRVTGYLWGEYIICQTVCNLQEKIFSTKSKHGS